MAGVKFSHPHPQVGDLYLRLPPTSVEWSFKLNTAVFDTSVGQVVQVLSISYDKFILSGQFGKEGPHGFRHRSGKDIERPAKQYFNLDERGGTSRQPYVIGLSQMTSYFRRYFNVATQGGEIRGLHDQRWITVNYSGGEDDYERNWKIYPTSFPSYRRSNEEFAPEWKIEGQVVEPDFNIDKEKVSEAISRIRKNVGYKPLNKFSDPLAMEVNPDTKEGRRALVRLTEMQYDELNSNIADYYSNMLPAYDAETLAELINLDASLPNVFIAELAKLQSKGVSSGGAPAKKTIRGGD